MKKLLIACASICTCFALADSPAPVVQIDTPIEKVQKVAKPHVLTVKEKLARIEYIDVTSEKETIEDATTELEPELEAILEAAAEADKD